METNYIPEVTYELCFFDLFDNVDSVQQYRTEKEAREVMRLFDEQSNADIYNRIVLSKTDWCKRPEQIQLDEIRFIPQ